MFKKRESTIYTINLVDIYLFKSAKKSTAIFFVATYYNT